MPALLEPHPVNANAIQLTQPPQRPPQPPPRVQSSAPDALSSSRLFSLETRARLTLRGPKPLRGLRTPDITSSALWERRSITYHSLAIADSVSNRISPLSISKILKIQNSRFSNPSKLPNSICILLAFSILWRRTKMSISIRVDSLSAPKQRILLNFRQNFRLLFSPCQLVNRGSRSC